MKLLQNVYEGRLYFWKEGQIFFREVSPLKWMKESVKRGSKLGQLERYQSINAYLRGWLSPQNEGRQNLFSHEVTFLENELKQLGKEGERIYFTEGFLRNNFEVFFSNPLWVGSVLAITQRYPQEERFLMPDRSNMILLKTAR